MKDEYLAIDLVLCCVIGFGYMTAKDESSRS